MKRTINDTGLLLLGMLMLVCLPSAAGAYSEKVVVDPNRYFTNGKINNNFSYNNLDIQPAGEGCLFRGTITNDSTVLQAVSITVRAVNVAEQPLWRHTINLPAVSAGSSYQFEETIDKCPDTVPYRLKFDVSR